VNPPDPCKLLTEEEFREGYPEFRGPLLSIIAFHLAEAAQSIDLSVWRRKTAEGHGLLTADNLCHSPSGKMAKMVPDSGKTSYGIRYAKLVKMVGGAYRAII
jgi:hypothetical protein